MLIIDVTAVNVALPAIQSTIDADLAEPKWVIDAYALINLPICVLIALLVLRGVIESRFPKATGPIDVPGLVTLGGSLFLLVLALIRGNEMGWQSGRIVGMLTGSVLFGATFLAIESRAKRPLLDLSLFGHPATICAYIAMFAAAISVFGMLTYIVFFIQNALGYDGFETGVRLLPMTAGAFAASMLASRLLGRVPSNALAGLGLVLAGTGAVIASVQVEPGSDWNAFLVGGVLLGMCHGLVAPSVAHAALVGAPAHQSGMPSGLNNSFRLVRMANWRCVLRRRDRPPHPNESRVVRRHGAARALRPHRYRQHRRGRRHGGAGCPSGGRSGCSRCLRRWIRVNPAGRCRRRLRRSDRCFRARPLKLANGQRARGGHVDHGLGSGNQGRSRIRSRRHRHRRLIVRTDSRERRERQQPRGQRRRAHDCHASRRIQQRPSPAEHERRPRLDRHCLSSRRA